MVDLVGSYQFDDQLTQGGDVFARDPYILRFRCLNTGDRHYYFNAFTCGMFLHRCGGAVNMYLTFVFLFYLCVHFSAEGPGDDSSSHQTGGLGEGA